MFKNMFHVKGRANRKEYCINIIFFILLILFRVYLVDQYKAVEVHGKSRMIIIINIITASALLLWIVHYHCLCIRRLHDINASGWWQLIIFIPTGQLLILWLIFKKGTPEPNKYGSPPEY